MPAPQIQTPLTLTEHLEELRRRLTISVATFVLAVGVGFRYAETVITWLQRPLGARLVPVVYFSPTEPLAAYLRVSLLVGVAAAMPVFLFHVWGFAKSGLTARERRLGTVLVVWGSAQFLAGVAFAYWALLPISLRVLLSIGQGTLMPLLSIDQYLRFVTGILWWCGLIFELPVVLWILSMVGIVTSEWLRQQRPYAIVILVTMAALVTPTTDPVNLLLMAVPLCGLYELSVWVTALAQRRRVA